MKRLSFFTYILCSMLLFSGCLKDFPNNDENVKSQINENVKKVFGTLFSADQDWCITTSGTVIISDIPSGVKKVQLLVYVADNDTTTSLTVLNEAVPTGKDLMLKYDAPIDNKGLFASFISDDNYIIKAVKDNAVSLSRSIRTRGADEYVMPTNTPTIGIIDDSYANIRGWIDGEKLYQLSDYSLNKIDVPNYSEADITSFRTLIFSYFKNGRDYNNLPLVKDNGCYNESGYPLTTGTKPIVVSPVYKSDKAKQYGNEVWNSDLYYYYFKDSDINGKTKDEQVAFFESLPKYKAIEFKQHFGETEDDKIEKHNGYVLMYFGDGKPEIGTTGSYTFPKGYKLGFMIRAKTDFKENGKPRKQGELYGDGRLNNYINNYSECNFKGSKLGTDGPRLAWLVINGKIMMCWESGTDRDFNDIIIEVEGGVEPTCVIPELDNNYYTFCFEDRMLGDYDMNDIVIKGRRIDNTHVEYTIVACGAEDRIQLRNVGNLSGVEVHALFNYDRFINTVPGETYFEPISTIVEVSNDFSFLNSSTQPYIYDMTIDKAVYLSKTGEDPHGIMIPNDFKYPQERVCIKDAYLKFNSWGELSITGNDWFKHPIIDKVY